MDEPVIIFHSPAEAREERVLEDTAEHPMVEEGMFVVDSQGVVDQHVDATQEAEAQVEAQTPEGPAAPVPELAQEPEPAPGQRVPWMALPYGAPAGPIGPGGPGGPGQAPPAPPFSGAVPPPPPYGPYGPQGPHGPQRRWPSRALMGTAAAVTAAGLGVGVVVGYAAFSSSSSSMASTSSSSATPVAAAGPGLVNIDTVLGYQTAGAAGTGMVLTSTGIVLTNNHVVEGATSIKATDVGNGHTYNATVLGYDGSADVAVIKLTGASGLSTVTLGNSSSVAVGQSVIALGNAGGTGGTPKVAQGTVTALDQAITASDQGASKVEHLTGMIESNAPIQAGDSGGALVDTAGQVIGMNTAGSSNGQASTSFGSPTGANVQAFSIPINTAMTIAHQIENGTASSTVHIGQTAFLGVEVSTSSQTSAASATRFGGSTGFGTTTGIAAQTGVGAQTGLGTSTGVGAQTGSGATVAGVVSGSPAASAGLSAGDVITRVDGHTVSSATDLSSVMDKLHPGSTVKITWTTATGQSASASVQLASGPVG